MRVLLTSPAERAVSLDAFTAIHELYNETAQEGNQDNADGACPPSRIPDPAGSSDPFRDLDRSA